MIAYALAALAGLLGAADLAAQRWVSGRVSQAFRIAVPVSLLAALAVHMVNTGTSGRLRWLAMGLVFMIVAVVVDEKYVDRPALKLSALLAMLVSVTMAFVMLPPYGQRNRPLVVLGVAMLAMLLPVGARLWRAMRGNEPPGLTWLVGLNGIAIFTSVYLGVASSFIQHSGNNAVNYANMAGVLLLLAALLARAWERYVTVRRVGGWFARPAGQLAAISLTLGALLLA